MTHRAGLRLAFVFLLTGMLTAACAGSGPADSVSVSALDPSHEASARPGDTNAGTSPRPGDEPPAGARNGSGAGEGSGSGAGGAHDGRNTLPLEVTLNRSCARPGDVMQAEAVTVPEALMGFAAAYSDNDYAPDFTYVPAETNVTGTFTWTWTLKPDTPKGDAELTVLAAKGDRNSTVRVPFRVAASC